MTPQDFQAKIEDEVKNVDYSSFLAEMGLENLDEKEKKDFEERLDSLIGDRIMLRIVAEMSEQDLEAADKMEPEEVMARLEEFGIDLNKIAAEEGRQLRDEFMGNMAYFQGYIEGMNKGKEEKKEDGDEEVRHASY